VIARDEADDIGPRLGEQALDLGVGRVDAQDQGAVLGLGADQELRRVGTGDGGHQGHSALLFLLCGAGGAR